MGKVVGSVASIITAPLTLLDKSLGGTVSGLAMAGIGAVTGQKWLIGLGLTRLLGQPMPRQATSRLTMTFDADTPRKAVYGTTAAATDLIYSEPSGEDQDYVDYIIALAAHRVHAIRRIWIDDRVAWTSAGGVQGVFAGHMWVAPRTEGTAANAITINAGTVWTAAECRMTGCAYLHLRVKRTGNSKKASSPFASGLSGKLVVEVDGMPVYDPRRDSTRGGDGPHRVEDQDTWDFDGSNNHALQALAELIGWRIGGEVSVGVGMPPDRIDFADFAMAANICDEPVPLKDGGWQKRYEGGGLLSDETSPPERLQVIMQACHGELRDVHGRIGMRISIDDFAVPLVHFRAGDVLGGYEYSGQNALDESPNVIRGRYVDPSDASIYQPAPFVEYRVPSDDGVDRVATLNLSFVQDPVRARRIAKQALLRLRVGGDFQADYGPRAWAVRPGDLVAQSFAMAGLTGDLFRVSRQELRHVFDDAGAQAFCPMVLSRDHPGVYAWVPAEDELLPDAAVAPVSYDPTRSMLAVIEDEIPPPIFP